MLVKITQFSICLEQVGGCFYGPTLAAGVSSFTDVRPAFASTQLYKFPLGKSCGIYTHSQGPQ